MTDTVPIRDYVDLVGHGLQDEVDRRFTDLKEQIEISRRSMELRLQGMNEFRAALTDTSARMVTRETLDDVIDRLRSDHKRFDQGIDDINGTLAQLKGRQLAYATVVAGVLALVSILSFLAQGSIIHVH